MDEYLGIVKLFAGSFAPNGWAFCDGRLLAISSNSALYSILGTTYGGDGTTTFGLPDLRSRIPVGAGNGPGLSPRVPGEIAGAESVTLTGQQLPMHTHTLGVSNVAGTTNSPANGVLAQANYTDNDGNNFAVNAYGATANAQAAATAISPAGSSQPVSIMPPVLGMNYIICTEGLYPSRG